MANNDQSTERPKLRTRPIFIVANLLFAIFFAIFISSADNLSVRGGGFSVYAGPSGGPPVEFDAEGNPIPGSARIIATGTPPATEIAPEQTAEAGQAGEGDPADPAESGSGDSNDSNNGDGPDTVFPGVTTTSTACPPVPSNWHVYWVKRGDLLSSLAARSGTTYQHLQRVNCLPSAEIKFGTKIFLPRDLGDSQPNITPIVVACAGVPAGWLPYTVQPGDNVFRIALGSGISREDVVKFNCLASETDLQVGQVIYLPPGSTYVQNGGSSGPLLTPLPTDPPPPTAVPPTSTPVPTASVTPTELPTETSTVAPSPTETLPVETATPTLVATETATETAIPTAVLTDVPTATTVPPTAVATATGASTAVPTSTDVPPTATIETATVAPTAVPPTATTVPTVAPTNTLAPTIPPTVAPTAVLPTATLEPTAIPPTATVEPTAIPPTAAAPTALPPTETTTP